MAVREAISKAIRFEVFKRDKFTCQYCGSKAPDVVLNVDHIDPVANGGTNEIINLITSCFECNNGKRDILLNDDSKIVKQRKQLELLQERREQIELMLEWKKSLSAFDNDVQGMICDYINSKIAPLTLNENGKRSIGSWLKKFNVDKILDGIDTAATKYLKYKDDDIDQDSAELFLKKIGGVIVVAAQPPVQQKIAYIKGIARNRFAYWNEQQAAMLLSNYVKALEQHYDEGDLLNDLNKEVERITKEAKNWTEWKEILEKWTQDIKAWEKNKSAKTNISDKDFSIEELESFTYHSRYEQYDYIKAIEYIGKVFPDFDQVTFRQILLRELITFLETQNDFENGPTELDEIKLNIRSYIDGTTLKDFFEYENHLENTDLDFGVLFVLYYQIIDLLIETFFFCYFVHRSLKHIYVSRLMDMFKEALLEEINS